jgi:aspartyl-tRNA(Asn)/glutamyl-tRNA(Gln) amidotransferase subunit A
VALTTPPLADSPLADGPRRPSRRRFLAATAAALAGLAGPAPRRAAAADLTEMTLREAADALRGGRASATDLARACLARIDRLQPTLNAFITVAPDAALAEARARDDEARTGRWRGPLHGIPLALKDNIDTAGLRTSAASAVLADRVPAEDAEVTRRLRAAGAILLGKLNMDEFAVGGTSTVSYWSPVRNPWMTDRSAGGSSGGSAAAVAAGLCFGALGTDTTGSLRIPAAFCSVVGLKPTYGRVSARGVIPLSWTLDHVGPVARTVDDAALLLGVIAGHDPRDPASADVPVPDYVAGMRAVDVARLRVGAPRPLFYDRLDPEVAAAGATALGVLRGLTAGVRDVHLPAVTTTPLVTDDEMYAAHADWFSSVPHLYQPSTRRALEAAAKITARDYIVARREIERLRRAVGAVFDGVDVLAMPTVKIQPRTIEESIRRSQSQTALPPELTNTGAFNVFGLPAISVPCGFTAGGLPIGLQIVGPHFGEARVLAVARAYEQATTWHRRRPA